MTIPDEAVQAAAEVICAHDNAQWGDSGSPDMYHDLVGKMLTAALPFLQGVKVKALEWTTCTPTATWKDARTVLGIYSVHPCLASNYAGQFVLSFPDNDKSELFPTEEAAKAAAQADYEARILSAIEVSASDCECTKTQQDESCPVGYPSLLCEICDGKGVVPSPRAQALEEAAKFIDKRVSDYVQEHGVTDSETGTVEFPGWGDEYVSELEELAEGIRALSSQPVADHIADASKKVADGWLPIETAPKDGTTFIVVNTGEIQRWHTIQEGVVITVPANDRPTTCAFYAEDLTFIDEFGEVYTADGVVIDAEDLTAADNVLRLTHWCPLPASPGASDIRPTGDSNHGE